MSEARWLSPACRPATLRILVSVNRFLKWWASSTNMRSNPSSSKVSMSSWSCFFVFSRRVSRRFLRASSCLTVSLFAASSDVSARSMASNILASSSSM